MLNQWRTWMQGLEPEEYERRRAELLAEAPIPWLWLLGKTGSGKTSIIRYLTGAGDAEIGNGFRPQTRHSRLYSFPDADAPVLRFLDTRGLGEAKYDPAADLAEFDAKTHLMIVTVRATDQAAQVVTEPLQRIREANPERPVLLAVTCLHDCYPQRQHPHPDPFDENGRSEAALPGELQRALDAQRERFAGLYDRLLPIDLTPAEEGFEEPNFGGQRLKQAIADLLPAAYRQTLLRMEHLKEALGQLQWRRSSPVILAHSVLAASAAAIPLPWIDIPAVLAIQSHLAHRLAALNQQRLDGRRWAEISAALSGRIAARMVVRETLKFIPWVGSAANAAAAFAMTFAAGWAWNWYFMEIKGGHVPTADQLRHVYQRELAEGLRIWQVQESTP